MLEIKKEELKSSIEGVWDHLIANGASQEEIRFYYDMSNGELFSHSNVGSNWSLRDEYLNCFAAVSQNVDLAEWFEIIPIRDENNDIIGVWWDDNPNDEPFTEDDFYTEIFEDYIINMFLQLEDRRWYDRENDELITPNITGKELDKLDHMLDDVLDELRVELDLDDEKALMAKKEVN